MKTIALGLLVASGLACNDTPQKRFEDQQKNIPAPNLDVSKQPTVDLTRNEAADGMVKSVHDLYAAKAPDRALLNQTLAHTAKAIDTLQHPASADSRNAMNAALLKAQTDTTPGSARDVLDADLKALKSAQVPLADRLIEAAQKEVDAIDRTNAPDGVVRHATCAVASAVAVASALNALDCAANP